MHLAEYAPPHGGSFIPFLVRITEEAVRRGWPMTVVLPEQARGHHWLEGLEAAGADVHFLSGSRAELVSGVRSLAAAKGDRLIMHSHFTTYDVAAVTVARSSPRMRVFWHIHTVLSTRPRVVAANMVKFSLFGRYTERILCPAASIAAGVARRLGPASRIELFPSPIDTDRFSPVDEEERHRARHEYEIPEGTKVILIFARLWELKGGDRLLAALGELVRDGEPLLCLFNEGGDRARAEIQAAGLDAYARVVGPTPDVRTLFAAADVFVAPSRGEGMPFAVVEALSCGRPVVASDLAGHRFMADRVETCRLVDGEPGPLAAAIRTTLARSPQENESLGRDAHRWIRQNLDLDVATTRLFDMYMTALESGS